MLPNLTELLQNKVGQTLTQYVTQEGMFSLDCRR